MTEYAARVYDLDGTLVRLAVDWDAVDADVRALFRNAGIDVDDDARLWELLERAPEHGLADAVEETVAGHETDGARNARRLETADELVDPAVPVAVCSLNCEAAVRLALDRHGLRDHVDAIVGRDTVATHKPDPEPLLAAIRELGVEPGEALFVGDSERDEVTAERAGVDFEYVGDGPTDY